MKVHFINGDIYDYKLSQEQVKEIVIQMGEEHPQIILYGDDNKTVTHIFKTSQILYIA